MYTCSECVSLEICLASYGAMPIKTVHRCSAFDLASQKVIQERAEKSFEKHIEEKAW